jgi:hypothetical protein
MGMADADLDWTRYLVGLPHFLDDYRTIALVEVELKKEPIMMF